MQLINAVAIGSMIAMNSNTDNNMELEAQITFGSSRWFIYAGICCFLVLFAGIMSGLALGLMSLSLVDLEILERSGTPSEKRQAAAILPVVQRQHQLLVTLLLCNASAVEALPIYLDKLFNQYVAILLSVTFVLAFGEVIPQAICTRYGLAVGASFIWLVRILMIICYPIAYPIGKVLDFLLGHHEALFRRSQLKALVSIHGKEAGKGGDLTHDETTIISGALDLKEKTAREAMTPIESTFSLDVNSKLDREAIEKILLRGHSRVPVYNGSPRNLIGVLLVKTLLTVKPETETPVSAVSMRKIPRFPADMPLYDVLNEFQKGNSHMAAVVKAKPKNIKPSSITDTVEMDENKDTNENSGLLSPLLPKSNENSDDTVETEKIQEQSYMNKQIFSQLDDTLPSVMPESSDTEELDDNKDTNENLDLVTPLLSATNETADDTVETVKVSEEANPSKKNLSHLDNTSPSVMPCSSDDTEDGEVIGIITLEDVFEELLQEEIVDETDEFVDVHKRIRVAAVAAAAASSLARSPSFRKLASQKGAAGQITFGQSMTKPSECDPTSNRT